MTRQFTVIVALLIALLPTASFGAESDEYVGHIKPLLRERCFACHGALKQESGLRLDTVAAMKIGGDGGPTVTPKRPDSSRLIERVSAADPAERMPPEGQPLTAEQIELLRRWIAWGATGPGDEKPEADPREHWAFQPPLRITPPEVRNPDWNHHPIDRFLAADHQRQRLTPAELANPAVLLRRVYLDLIGLPPSREEMHDFCRDPSEVAYQKTVERLLASPQYGERWARHWMDIWRYSDWYGRRGVNDVRNSYPHIWRWRDWIVESLNADHGYDQMISEMLAADEISPEDDRQIAATGFIVRNWYSLNYDQWMRDLVEHTGKAFLGLRLNCALCHDHKYDPISQREYFAFRAFFEPLELRQDRVPDGPPLVKYLRYKPGSNSSVSPISAGLARIYDEYPDQETYLYRGGDSRDRVEGEPPVKPGVPAILGSRLDPPKPVHLSPPAYYPNLKSWVEQEELTRLTREQATAETELVKASDTREGTSELRWLRLLTAELNLDAIKAEREMIVAKYAAERAKLAGNDSSSELAKRAATTERQFNFATARRNLAQAKLTAVDASTKVTEVETTRTAFKAAQVALETAAKKLAVADKERATESSEYSPLGPVYRTTSTGRRRSLAAWITNRDNPLTARVAVNHVWNWHFGRPIVTTTHDLGRSGEEPSHAALLDWLAVELMERDWSVKHLHRLIVTSRAYRMSSDSTSIANLARDKNNRSWWRFDRQRLDAETLRDSLLKIAGLLDPTLGGPDLDNKTSTTTTRRSLYFSRFPEEGGVMAFTAQFDPPDPCDCYRRSETLVPQQALAMMNSELTLNVSRTLARRLLSLTDRNAPLPSQRKQLIVSAFEQILNRAPRPTEEQLCVEFLARQTELYQSIGPGKLLSQSVAGVPAASVEPETRTAESLVRSLLSHHDFITIH